MTTRPLRLITFLSEVGRPQLHHQPWTRYELQREGWERLCEKLSEHTDWVLLALWAEGYDQSRNPPVPWVHVALFDEKVGVLAVASLKCPDYEFPSLAKAWPGAIPLEWAIHDLRKPTRTGLTDLRPWLVHPADPPPDPPYELPTAEVKQDAARRNEDCTLHYIPVGPVHAGIIEPGYFRFTCHGETVVRLEIRLGYVHKGIEGLLSGKLIGDAAKIVGRVSGDSTVAYALAFARAVEEATGTEVPKRAHYLRALMAEMERVANHLGDIGAICNDASFVPIHARCGRSREDLLRAAEDAFGHRLMMDCIVSGGVKVNLTDAAANNIVSLVTTIKERLEQLVDGYHKNVSLKDRTVGIGKLSADLAHRYGAGGFIGRASSRCFDARRQLKYPPYDSLTVKVPVVSEGDVDARLRIRIEEVKVSLDLIVDIITSMPQGVVFAALNPTGNTETEGLAVVEGFRGDVLVWVRLAADGKTVLRCHHRDPSWFQWTLLGAAIDKSIVADFPLCNKSFNCSYAGHDL